MKPARGRLLLPRRRFLKLAAPALLLSPREVHAAFASFQTNGPALDPWTNLDGRLNAPGGTAQFPTILNGYPTASPPGARVRWPTLTGTQPQWQVAGIDYPVGINRNIYPTDGNLKDPTNPANLPSGCTYHATQSSNIPAQTILVEASNVTLDGFDCSGSNGIGIMIGNPNTPTFFNNLTVTNCKFVSRSNSTQTFVFVQGDNAGANWCSNVTMKYCNIDGGGSQGFGSQSTSAPFVMKGNGNMIVQYNWFNNFSHHGMDLQPNNTTVTPDVRFNVFSNYGYNGGHPNPWYFESNASGLAYTFQNGPFDFNLICETSGAGTAGGDSGLAIFSTETAYVFLSNLTANFCTVLAQGSGGSGIGPIFSGNSGFYNPPTYQNTNISISNCYYDPTNNNGDAIWAFNSSFPYGPTFTSTTPSANINATDGSTAPAHPT